MLHIQKSITRGVNAQKGNANEFGALRRGHDSYSMYHEVLRLTQVFNKSSAKHKCACNQFYDSMRYEVLLLTQVFNKSPPDHKYGCDQFYNFNHSDKLKWPV